MAVRIIVVVDLARQTKEAIVQEGLLTDYKKIRQKIPEAREYIYCSGYNGESATLANLLALDLKLSVQFNRRLEDIEKYSHKLARVDRYTSPAVQSMVQHQETLSLCMFHLQQFIHHLKENKQNNILVVTNAFGCRLLLTYALGISTDAVDTFHVNAGSVILLDIHDMSSMNKIHF